MILLLGWLPDVTDEFTYDTAKIEAFKVPAGTVVEMYETTLHYAPCNAADGGFKLLNDRALLAFEMGFDQRELMETAIKEFFGDYPFEIIKDINGKDRMLFIYYNLK